MALAISRTVNEIPASAEKRGGTTTRGARSKAHLIITLADLAVTGIGCRSDLDRT